MKQKEQCHDEHCHCHEHHDEHACSCHEHHEHHDEHACSCHEHHEHHDEHACSCHEHHEHHDEHVCSCHGHHEHHHEHDGACCAHCEAKLHGENEVQKGVLIRLCLCAVLLVALFFVPSLGYFSLLLYLIPYLLVGYSVLLDAFQNILRGKVFDEQFLMAIATIGAFAIGDYAEGVAVMLFYQTGEFFQTLAVGKSRRSIAALADIRPDRAIVLRDGKELEVAPEEVLVGECVLVRVGERIPLDGIILQGETTVNNVALTGESLPQSRREGERVVSGGVNMSGVIYIKVESAYHESTVAKILELVEHSSAKKAKVEKFITRFSRYYTPFVVICALLLAFLPPLLFSQELAEWVHRALVFLVVSCPCALVISVPLAFFGGIGGASRRGILIKGAGYVEQLARVETVVFDKTGTLTKGSFALREVRAFSVTQAELLAIAASAEQFSKHPVAICIANAYRGERLEAQNVSEIAGKGVQAQLAGKTYWIGNGSWIAERGVTVPATEAVGTTVYVADERHCLGYLTVADEIKAEAAGAVAELRACGVKHAVMLTGDNREIAARVAASVGVEEHYAELLPHQKVEHVERLLAKGGCTAFVGDGINDAPVLARADVGVAMGGMGSDAAIESADVVLMDDALSKLPTAIRLAKKTMRIVRQNIVFSLSVKAVILVLGALGIANMWIAVFGDVGVMLLAILNSMRAMIDRA